MKKFLLHNKQYEIPESWSDINLRQFLSIRECESKATEMEPIDYTLLFLSVVTQIPVEELEFMTAKQYDDLLKDMLSVTKSEIKTVVIEPFKIGETTYIFDTDTSKISIGQFADMDMILKETDTWANAHKICATFMRKCDNSNWDTLLNKLKKKPEYKISEYDFNQMTEASELFMEFLPMPYVYTIVIFFLIFAKKLEEILLDSSQAQEEKK